MTVLKRLGILGGTFDPIHKAHLACALESYSYFQLEKVKLIPCSLPPHREQPQRSALHRCNMVKLAIEPYDFLELDDRECKRDGHSYTVETLHSLRETFPKERYALFFILGKDAYQGILQWHHYQDLLELAHLIVFDRPEESFTANEEHDESLKHFTRQHLCDDKQELFNKANGCIYFLRGPMINISASRIRSFFDFDLPNATQNIQALSQAIPEPVKQYIHQHGLYQKRHY